MSKTVKNWGIGYTPSGSQFVSIFYSDGSTGVVDFHNLKTFLRASNIEIVPHENVLWHLNKLAPATSQEIPECR